jgi:hypothetical protein
MGNQGVAGPFLDESPFFQIVGPFLSTMISAERDRLPARRGAEWEQ